MCAPSLSTSSEALALRVEELEKKLSIMKYSQPAKAAASDVKLEKSEENSEQYKKAEKPAKPLEKETLEEFSAYQAVVEKITEIKAPLGVKLSGGRAFVKANSEFLIELTSFFAGVISKDSEALNLIKGVIADEIGRPSDEITLKIAELPSAAKASFISEIEL